MTLRLDNKVALITGAGTGIGYATAHRFAEEGARIVATGLEAGPLETLVAEIKSKGGDAIAIVQDVTDEARWGEVIDQAITKFGQLDVLINNAGIGIPGNVEEETLSKWRKTQAVNMEGVFLGTQAAIKVMKGHGGSIINVSSIEGIVGEPDAAAYNASKGGVRIFSKSAAIHCGRMGYNIRVNTLHPGFIETPLTTTNFVEQFGEEVAKAFVADKESKIPLGKMGQPIDMANGCLFLASDESRYMTGAELVMDGGFTAQ